MPRSTTAITATRNRAADAHTTKNSTTTTSAAAAAAAETAELLVDRYKTSLCKKYTVENGCPYEERCMFAHGKAELRTRAMNVADGLTTEEAVKVHQRKHRKNLRKPENASSPKKANNNNKTKDANKAETAVETTTTKPAVAATAVTTTPTAAGRKPVSINTGKPLFADIVAAKKQSMTTTTVVVAPSTPSAASDCGASSSDDEAASPYYYSYTHNPYAFNCLGVERAE